MKKWSCFILFFMLLEEIQSQNFITEKKEVGSFPIVSDSRIASIVFDKNDDSLVNKVAGLLQKDIEHVSGKQPSLQTTLASAKTIILIGNIHKSVLIQQLIKEKKLNVDKIRAKWEGFQIQLIKAPFKGIDQALVIAGNDRRGTAYGVFELANQMGVSPWYWWADVPVSKKKEIYIKPNTFLTDAPKVKYRGIFINDEAPALSGWSREKFGGFNHHFYEKVFELILRLKGNYLWPAMWGNAFYDDDKLNKIIADSYGIVIGTSHHEPLMRAHDEWRRYGKGKWDYDSNEVRLKQFWKGGMVRVQGTETIVSIGMRGDGDAPMSQGTAIALLERIVKDQRAIISETTKKEPSATPQLWALYKEVQDYYDKGMRVPDDVTLLLCDDNWGNIRKLPKLTDPPRKGGYGIYYHFDYVGGPRNYKWINTNNISRVWEQMHLAYEYGVDRIWIVNVGDIKPMEFPTSFFLDYAWNPSKWNEDNLRNYYTNWAAKQFGEKYASQIGEIIRKYSQYNARRKPELLSPETYSLTNYNEANNVVSEHKKILSQAEEINSLLPIEYRDAFFQLVLHPVKASANLNELYVATGLNWHYAEKGMAIANEYVAQIKENYIKDSLLTLEYHRLANGKWNHMMSQTHIGYTYWQQPPVNKMPTIKFVSEDSLRDPPPPYDSSIVTARHRVPLNSPKNVFYELDGCVSMEAENWTRAIPSSKMKWKTIPDIGRTGSGITTFPVTAIAIPGNNSPHLEYDFYTDGAGQSQVHLYFSPTLNFPNAEGLKFAISIDDEKPQTVILNKDDTNLRTWETWVANNIIIKKTDHTIIKPGKHTLKYWMISPAIILQKLVVDLGGLRPSYLGPPETKFIR